MTRYTVVWVKSALAELAEIWLDAPDRHAVSTAAQAIDMELGRDAPMKGSEMSEGLRAVLAVPLKAIFCVREAERIVDVLQVKSV